MADPSSPRTTGATKPQAQAPTPPSSLGILGLWLGYQIANTFHCGDLFKTRFQQSYDSYINSWIDDTYRGLELSERTIDAFKNSDEIADLKRDFRYISSRRITEISKNFESISSQLQEEHMDQNKSVKERVLQSLNGFVLGTNTPLDKRTIKTTIETSLSNIKKENEEDIKSILTEYECQDHKGIQSTINTDFAYLMAGKASIKDEGMEDLIRRAIEAEIEKINRDKIYGLLSPYRITEPAIHQQIVGQLTGVKDFNKKLIDAEDEQSIQVLIESQLSTSNHTILNEILSSYNIDTFDSIKEEILNEIDDDNSFRTGKKDINKSEIQNKIEEIIYRTIKTIVEKNSDLALSEILSKYRAPGPDNKIKLVNELISSLSEQIENLKVSDELKKQIGHIRRNPSLQTLKELSDLKLKNEALKINDLKAQYESIIKKVDEDFEISGMEKITFKSFDEIMSEVNSIKNAESKILKIKNIIKQQREKVNEALHIDNENIKEKSYRDEVYLKIKTKYNKLLEKYQTGINLGEENADDIWKSISGIDDPATKLNEFRKHIKAKTIELKKAIMENESTPSLDERLNKALDAAEESLATVTDYLTTAATGYMTTAAAVATDFLSSLSAPSNIPEIAPPKEEIISERVKKVKNQYEKTRKFAQAKGLTYPSFESLWSDLDSCYAEISPDIRENKKIIKILFLRPIITAQIIKANEDGIRKRYTEIQEQLKTIKQEKDDRSKAESGGEFFTTAWYAVSDLASNLVASEDPSETIKKLNTEVSEIFRKFPSIILSSRADTLKISISESVINAYNSAFRQACAADLTIFPDFKTLWEYYPKVPVLTIVNGEEVAAPSGKAISQDAVEELTELMRAMTKVQLKKITSQTAQKPTNIPPPNLLDT